MKELNYNTLRKALALLPLYQAPPEVWENLKKNLDASQDLQAALNRLPVRQAPDFVWQNITEALDADAKRAAGAKRGFRVILSRTVLAAAASLALVAFALWLVQRPSDGDEAVAAVYETVTQDTVDTVISAVLEEPEDAGFALVETLCAQKDPLCEVPEFKALKSELDELTDAKSALRTALGEYGDDPELANQLVRIEQERSTILQQMIALCTS